MRSLTVVFPASMWAMIPMFRMGGGAAMRVELVSVETSGVGADRRGGGALAGQKNRGGGSSTPGETVAWTPFATETKERGWKTNEDLRLYLGTIRSGRVLRKHPNFGF